MMIKEKWGKKTQHMVNDARFIYDLSATPLVNMNTLAFSFIK